MDEERMDAEESIVAESEQPGDGEGNGDAGAGEAWKDVVDRLDELGDAIGRWAKAAATDPANRERVTELKEHIVAMGERVGDTVDSAVESDAGQKVKDAAGKAGEAIRDFGDKLSDEVFPRMASAFETATSKLHDAAERMESRTTGQADTGEATAAEAPPGAASPPETPDAERSDAGAGI